MSSKEMKELSKLSEKELRQSLNDALREKVSLDAKVHAGTEPKAAELSRGMRKRIARIKTLLRQRETVNK